MKKLTSRRIAMLAADGFEKAELEAPLKALKAQGAKVDIISIRKGRIRGMNLHEPAGKVRVDKTISEVKPSDYDALMIPGGFINPDLLRQSAEVREFVRSFALAERPIASLCHGPWVLASSDLLNGRTLTSWPGIRDDLVNAGAIWLDEPVVIDKNLVTSRGPQDLPAFIKAVTQVFSSNASLIAKDNIGLISSPQAQEPPKLVLGTMKWMPRPLFRTLGLVSTVGLGYIFTKTLRRELL